MADRRARSLSLLMGGVLGLVGLAGCTPTTGNVGGDGDGGAVCQDNLLRCEGQTAVACTAGMAAVRSTCAAPQVCAEGLGCADCLPAQKTTCVGSSVYSCGADGKVGGQVMTCANGCQGGLCLGGGGNCGAAGTELIYVIDKSAKLLSFDPRGNANTFKLVGTLACPAGPSLRGGAATPLSMAVARDGRAYVLYTSGQVFSVSISDASCQTTSYKSGVAGFQFFGMGFSTDAEGGATESLFIGGGDALMQSSPSLGRMTAASLTPTSLGTLMLATYPELSGTSKGEIYAYFPGPFQPRVHLLNKANGATNKEWKLTAPSGTVRSYAFAHWGGQFYIFQTTEDQVGALTSRVARMNPADGSLTTVVASSPYQVVGAGVSTCAPLILG